ncbi:MAG: hypothetical protein L6R41_000589 [Letrouitia leprolyta]|nr:MAG: hypothetical protein L6R41_000589 [Letrouitia leprolyta]
MARDHPRDERSFNVNDLQTRISWQSLLRQTFGRQASSLLRLKIDLGTAIGSAARVFLEYAKPRDASIGSSFGWYGHGAASYGPGFLHFVCSRLPEVASSRDTMESASQASYPDAISAYGNTQERLRSICECNRCYGVKKRESPGVRGQPLCLRVLCGFVIQLALDLSVTSAPSSLLPMRSGLELLYQDYSSSDLQFEAGGNVTHLRVSGGFMKAWTYVAVLFTGHEEIISNNPPNRETLALARSGLCFYLGALARLSDKPEEMLHTFIIPGCIETRTGRLYSDLNNTRRFTDPVFNYSASPIKPCSKLPKMPRLSKENLKVSAVVEETMINLTTHFIVEKASNSSVICSPSTLISKMHESCGQNYVVCLGRDCPELDIASLSVATIEGEGAFRDEVLKKAGFKIGLRLVADDPVARILALLIDQIHQREDGFEAEPRPCGGMRDGWLDYGDPDTVPMNGDEEGFRQESLENDQLPVVEGADEASSRPCTPLKLDVDALLQGAECLPCTIRTAVAMTGRKGHSVYIVCR